METSYISVNLAIKGNGEEEANKPVTKNGKSKAKAGAKKEVKSPKSIKIEVTTGTGPKENGIELKFSADPRGHKKWDDAKDSLHEGGFHWNPRGQCWYRVLLGKDGKNIPGVMERVEEIKSLLQ